MSTRSSTPFGLFKVTEAGLYLRDNTIMNATSSRHGLLPKLDGNSAHFLDGTGAWSTPAGGGGGKVAQVVNTQTGSMSTGTTVIPLDNTIPQNTEGDQYMSLSITPTSSSNKLKIDVVVMASASSGTIWLTAALFQDSTANALASQPFFQVTATGGQLMVFSHYMTAGTTSSTTFKVRVGPHSAATVTFNGQAGGALMGGTIASSITITEIVP